MIQGACPHCSARVVFTKPDRTSVALKLKCASCDGAFWAVEGRLGFTSYTPAALEAAGFTVDDDGKTVTERIAK